MCLKRCPDPPPLTVTDYAMGVKFLMFYGLQLFISALLGETCDGSTEGRTHSFFYKHAVYKHTRLRLLKN